MQARITFTVRVPPELARLVEVARGDETLNAFLSRAAKQTAEAAIRHANRAVKGKRVRRG